MGKRRHFAWFCLVLALGALLTSCGLAAIYTTHYDKKGMHCTEFGLIGFPVISDDPPMHGLVPLWLNTKPIVKE